MIAVLLTLIALVVLVSADTTGDNDSPPDDEVASADGSSADKLSPP